MFNDKKYLEVFKFILLAAVAYFVLQFIGSYARLQMPRVTEPNGQSFSYILTYTGPMVLFYMALWWGIGKAFDAQREAMIAMGLALLGLSLNFVLISDYRVFSLSRYLIRLVAKLLPFIAFGYLVFKDKRMLTILLVGFVSFGVYSFGRGGNNLIDLFLRMIGFRNLFRISVETGSGSSSSFNLLHTIISSMCLPVIYLVFSRVMIACKNKTRFLTGKTMDLSTSLSMGMATVIFIIFSFVIFNMSVSPPLHYRNTNATSGFWVVQIITVFEYLVALYLVALTYRNFLSEHLISRKKKLSWLYFFINIPFVNIIAWFVNLITPNNLLSLSDRVQTFQASQKKTNGGIKTLMIILTSILLLYQLEKLGFRIDGQSPPAALAYVVTSVVSIGLLIWYLNAPSGLIAMFVLITLNLLIMIFLPQFLNSRSSYTLGGVTNFYGLANAIILFALFHLKYVENISPVPLQPMEDIRLASEEE